MAGIGIKLNRIFNEGGKSISRTIYGSVYSTLATIAPMLLVIGTMLLMYIFLNFESVGYWDRELFSCSILYVFIFALLTAAPFNSVLSKYVGDRIFEERYQDILPCNYVGLFLNMGLAALVGIPFCVWAVVVGHIPVYYVATTFFCYISLGLCFHEMLYLSILKQYRRVSVFFAVGMLVTFVLSLVLHYIFGVSITYSMLFSMFVGFFLIACFEFSFVKRYFHSNSHHYREVFGYFRLYWKLVLTNFFYVLGLYVHNFVFWTKEDMRLVLADTYVCNQPYDMASCIAMFTNISASVIFIAYVEMYFRKRYQDYNEAVIGGRLKDVMKAKGRMFRLFSDQIVRIVNIQFIISVVLFLVCLIVLPRLGMSGLVMSIYPCMAAGYFVLFITYTVILYLQYFNDLTGSMLTGIAFCVSVFIFSLLSMNLPEDWYALGVFAGSIVGWTVAYFRVRWVERHLNEHIFCRGSIVEELNRPMPSPKVYDRRLGGFIKDEEELDAEQ